MSSISDYMRDSEVSKVQMLSDKPECYAIRFEDGSAMLVNGDGKIIKSPLDRYEFICEVRPIGRLHGIPHFVYKACDYPTRYHPEYGMFDNNGHEKLFRDTRICGLESVNEIEAEFKKLVDASNDLSNPRRNDEMLVDLSAGKSLEMER